MKALPVLLTLGLALGACSLFDKEKKKDKKKDTAASNEPTAPLNPPPPAPPPPPPVTTYGKDLGAAEAVALSLKELGATAKLYADCADRKIPRTGCYQIIEGDAVNAAAPTKAGTPEEPKITDPE